MPHMRRTRRTRRTPLTDHMFLDADSMAPTNSEENPLSVHESPDELTMRLQTSLYSIDSVRRAAHRFTDQCFVHIEYEDQDNLLCRLRLKQHGDSLTRLAGEFMNEVLDQTLRAQLAAETEQIRLLLLSHAFSNTNILHPDLNDVSPAIDPLHIGEHDTFTPRTTSS